MPPFTSFRAFQITTESGGGEQLTYTPAWLYASDYQSAYNYTHKQANGYNKTYFWLTSYNRYYVNSTSYNRTFLLLTKTSKLNLEPLVTYKITSNPAFVTTSIATFIAVDDGTYLYLCISDANSGLYFMSIDMSDLSIRWEKELKANNGSIQNTAVLTHLEITEDGNYLCFASSSGGSTGVHYFDLTDGSLKEQYPQTYTAGYIAILGAGRKLPNTDIYYIDYNTSGKAGNSLWLKLLDLDSADSGTSNNIVNHQISINSSNSGNSPYFYATLYKGSNTFWLFGRMYSSGYGAQGWHILAEYNISTETYTFRQLYKLPTSTVNSGGTLDHHAGQLQYFGTDYIIASWINYNGNNGGILKIDVSDYSVEAGASITGLYVQNSLNSGNFATDGKWEIFGTDEYINIVYIESNSEPSSTLVSKPSFLNLYIPSSGSYTVSHSKGDITVTNIDSSITEYSTTAGDGTVNVVSPTISVTTDAGSTSEHSFTVSDVTRFSIAAESTTNDNIIWSEDL